MERIVPKEKIKLQGFNNLTKVLSFNLYDFCITLDNSDHNKKDQYLDYINRKYNAQSIINISEKICKIIGANIISTSQQDYDPVGASGMVLMSDVAGGKWDAKTSFHLDKSHITVHTYPDVLDQRGICSFRVDIDIATCGDIIPLTAMNYLFSVFECDVVFIDYVIRGYTRAEDGRKIFNDHHFSSIREFIEPKIVSQYMKYQEINMPNDNIWQTKLCMGPLLPANYLIDEREIHHPDFPQKLEWLKEEMAQVFNLSF